MTCSCLFCSLRCGPGGSVGEEVGGDGCKLVVILEDATVAGVGVDDQLAALDAAVKVFGEGRGHHAVVVAVGDQGGLGGPREVRGGGTGVLLDRLELCPERLG